MGAYLSQPKTEKLSTDEMNKYLAVGASSMQGWRNSQEDAHNAILDFDKNTAFFAVYDGHGGAEVSTYCADKLPNFLKALDAYKSGNFEQALKDAFLGFDKMLLDPVVIEILKLLAGEKNLVDGDDSDALDDDEDENLAELHEEGSLPLDEVMEKYKGHPSMPSLKKLKESASSGSKPQSPYLRGRRAAAVIADAANRAELDPESKPEGSSTSKAAMAALQDDGPSSSKSSSSSSSSANKMETEEDSTVSSSSSSASKSNTKNSTANVAAEAEPSPSKTSNGKATTSSPDSSVVKENEQNGSVSSSETKPLAKSKQSVFDVYLAGLTDTASKEHKQNGNVESSTKSPSKKDASSAAAITSTSKEQQKDKANAANIADDSNDEDDVDANESNARQALEYSSEEEEDLGEDDIAEEEDADYDDDDDDDEVDDDDEDGEDEEEDEESYLANEQFCANMIEEPGKDSGCTAVVGLLNGRDLYVANAGDSRCVVCRNGKAIEMSLDHKPEDDEESARIVKAGGRVTLDGRVNGGLNLSRALGDHAYKMTADLPAEEQMISALPDIKKLIVSPEDEFMVLACDGIWNFMTSEEVVDFVRLRLMDEKKKISKICEELFDACLAPNTLGDGTGCDNMTAVIVRFKPSILELPTKIDPKEAEDILLAKQKEAGTEETSSSPGQKAQKRAASPTSDDNSNEAENKTKRLKTDTDGDNADDDDKDNTSSSKPPTTSVDATTTTKTTSGDSSTSSTVVQKECDSGVESTEAKIKEAASSVVSST